MRSTEICFIPRTLEDGTFSFDIGTSGSVTLLLQTLIPPLLLAQRPSRVTLTGGTHVPMCPSFHYLAEVFAPMLRRIGGELHLAIDEYGFYPAAAEESTYTTSRITRHLMTNLWVTALFLPFSSHVEGEEGQAGRVTISPTGELRR